MSLHDVTYTRPADRRAFTLKCLLGAMDTKSTVAVVLIDASNPGDMKTARSNLRLAKDASQFCWIVFTKVDCVPTDALDMRYQYLWFERHLCYHYEVDALSANLFDKKMVHQLIADLVDGLVPLEVPTQSPWDLKTSSRRVYDAILDWVASCFALPVSVTTTPNADELSSLVTFEDVWNLADKAADWEEELKQRLLVPDARSVGVHRITPSLLAKEVDTKSERASMEFVRQHTTIPVPRTYHPHLPWLVMDYIEGDMLMECWHKQSAFMQFRIACTLRGYVKQLHSLKRDTMGTIDEGNVHGIVFEEQVFSSLQPVPRFRRFCDMAALLGWKIIAHRNEQAGVPLPTVPKMPSNWSPTFIHGDLNNSNILLDKHGVLWLLDWDSAGFYPPSLETWAMQFVADELHAEDTPPSWRRYRNFIAGKVSTEEKEYWMHVYTVIHRFRGY
ncbi:hypothetical protein FKP32DRAFT_1590214 [Trametes sanguinea]|nr:hypothetical protein FKP32DRAFT_1590214 [Trametes sanguinea]